MDDYIRREAAKAQIRKAYTRIEDRVAINCVINDVPAADVVPVVRCRDCIHNYANMVPGGEGCAKCTELPIAPDFFCKSGERKGGDE